MLRYKPTLSVISRKRARLTTNVFCPTGEGGGVDPSCSPNVQLGYARDLSDPTQGYTHVPDKQKVEHLLSAHKDAVQLFKDKGIDIKGKDSLKLVAREGNQALAYATGAGINYHFDDDSNAELGRQFSETIKDREAGWIPGFSMQSHEDVFIHEIGHNLMRDFSKSDRKEWENLFTEFNADASHLPSIWAQENSSELWAESVLSVMKGYKFGDKDQNPAVENFVRQKLGLKITTNAKPKSKKPPNPLRIDPTRSATLRRLFLAEVTRRFKALNREIYKLVVEEDEFGLREESLDPWTQNVFCPTGKGGGIDATCSPSGSSKHLDWAKEKFGNDEKAKAFVKWFGDSKVVDEEGNPLVVYHGTNDDFNEFDSKNDVHFATSSHEMAGMARYTAKFAGEYGREAGGNLKPIYVRLNNPATMDEFNEKGVTWLKSKGYDGAKSDDNRFVVAFHNSQIKSAIGNRGTFDESASITNAGQWKWEDNSKKIELFRQWLTSQVQKLIYGETTMSISMENNWWDAYIASAYQKGIGRAWDQVKGGIKDAAKQLGFYQGTREEFLRSAFNRPVHRDKVKLMASRTFNDLKGVTDAMSTKITRTLVDGLIQGEGPMTIARQMNEDVENIGIDRAKTIARTEITRVHAEGQLDAMERLGVVEVGVSVEWSTAEDEAVCPLCQPMEGVVLSIEEARGLIPRHPNCRCAMLPANVGEDQEEQKRGQSVIQRAIDASLRAEIPKTSKGTMAEQKEKSRWGGAKATISKSRPKSILDGSITNVFCPTGPGGGVDPTCSPGGVLGMPASDPRSVIFKAMKVIELDADRGAMVAARDLRKETGLDKETFDRAAMSLVKSGYLSAHHHDHATHLTSEKLAELIDTGMTDIHPNDGRYKIGLSKRQDLSEAKPLESWTENVFCPTGPGGGVDPTCGAGGHKSMSLPIEGRLFTDIKPGNGAEHFNHVTNAKNGPNVRWTGPDEHDYTLPGREIRDSGGVTDFRAVHPDEPHSVRDGTWTKGAYARTSGGGFLDTSPPNPSGISTTAIKYWETAGTSKGTNAGENPQHSVIRAAADAHLGILGPPPENIEIGRLNLEKAESLAKNLVNSIEKASPSQPTLWRGIDGDQAKALSSSRDGDSVVFSLGSHSRDANAAKVYAGSQGVVLRILPGARGISTGNARFAQDQEVITGGHFKVVGKSVSQQGLMIVDLQQTGVHQWK